MQAEVAVVGGGLVGLCCAHSLSELGIAVTLVEKGELAAESSGRSFGWVSALLQHPAKLPLCDAGKRGWLRLQQEVGEIGLRREGIAFIAETAREMEIFDQWLQRARVTGDTDATLLASAEIARRFPGASRRWAGGILCASDGVTEPSIAAGALARTLRARGVRILTRCAARGLELSAGRVSGLITESGTIHSSAVIIATNQWAPLFCGNLDVEVPQLYMIETLGRTGPIPGGPVGAGGRFEWGWRRRIDGGYTVGRRVDLQAPLTRDSLRWAWRFLPALKAEWGHFRLSLGADARRDWRRPRRWAISDPSPFERERCFHPVMDRDSVDAAFQSLCGRFPAFRSTRVEEYWAGVVTITPDGMPIASSVPRIPGMFLVTGSTYGLTWAPALGRLMASLVVDRTTEIDSAPFRLGRFSDGSRLELLL